MLPKRMTVQIIAFLVLSGGVAANVFFLQTGGRGTTSARVSDAAARNVAAIQPAEFGDTGSIGSAAHPAANTVIVLAALSSTDNGAKPAGAASATEVTRAVQRELQIRGYETG